MKKLYRIYVGRFCVARFESESLMAATLKWMKVAQEIKSSGTVTLYDGPRSIENECCKQTITEPAARKKGGKNRWAGTTPEERKAEMRRIRAIK